MSTPISPQLNSDDTELLSAYLDQQLNDQERRALEARLDRDADLRQQLEELRATVTLLRSLEPLRPPRSFTIAPEQAQRPRAGWLNWLLATPIAAALGIALLFAFNTSGGSPAMQMAAAPTAMAESADVQRSALGEAVTMATPARTFGVVPAATAAPAPTAPPDLSIESAPAAVPEPTSEPGMMSVAGAPAVPEPTLDPATMSVAEAPTSPAVAPAVANDTADPSAKSSATAAVPEPGVPEVPATQHEPAPPPRLELLFGVPFVLTMLILALAGWAWRRRKKQHG
ncbi:MAG: zf-HC2 domain-containing protein [Roseiflexaceae bacterium]